MRVLQPQDLTVCDPACGSGHILVYAFDLLFEIYREQGYLERDIPGLILTHNLFGLDIDERAVQLASFAVLMKARSKNSRILRKPPMLNLVTVRSTRHLASQLAASQLATMPSASPTLINHQLVLGEVRSMQLPIVPQQANESRLGDLLGGLLAAFEDADHLGSLITPPVFDVAVLYAELEAMEQTAPVFVELFAELRHVVKQAELLRKQYWVVVANPPYMSGSSFNDELKQFSERHYPLSKSDLFSVFMERNFKMIVDLGFIAHINQHSWMFLSGQEDFRREILEEYTLRNMLHLGIGVFPEMNSKVVQSTAFVFTKQKPQNNTPLFFRLVDSNNSDWKEQQLLKGEYKYSNILQKEFKDIPGSPLAYWITKEVKNVFLNLPNVNSLMYSDGPCKTGKDDQYMRYLWEVSKEEIGENTTWVLCAKGGEYRKYYGNMSYVISWSLESRLHYRNDKIARITSLENQTNRGITWSIINSTNVFSFRELRSDCQFNSVSPTIFSKDKSPNSIEIILALLNSKVVNVFLPALNPTLAVNVENVLNIPVPKLIDKDLITTISCKMLLLAKEDWENFETTQEFQNHPLLYHNTSSIIQAFSLWQQQTEIAFQQLKQLEEQNNRYWIDAYGLQDELTPEVPDEQITIRRADLSRDIKSLISYAVGCMMGRYSLDKPGLIHAGQPFDPSQHTTFSADTDAILPITDQAYFDDDLVSRFIEFIKTAYSETHLRENLDFIANALTLRQDESPRDRIRRYFLTEFISDHIQTYKKRPIYWLFTSGAGNSKTARAFGALIYLHRYTPNTIAQIRTDYVLELQRKLMGEIDRTQKQLNEATTSTAKKAIQRRLKTLRDQDAELATYQAKLQTFADQRIQLDLDDGVAYNYTRFKGLVYEGSDLKMVDLEKKAQWKLDLSKSERSQ